MPIETPIIVLAGSGESVDDAAKADVSAASGGGSASTESSESASTSSGTASSNGTAVATPPATGRVRISPLARKLADEHGVDVNAIAGSGPGGRIIKRDVLQAAQGGQGGGTATAAPSMPSTPVAAIVPSAPIAAPVGEATLEARTEAVSGMRKVIAKRLVESKTTVPHFYLSTAIAMDALMDLRATLNEQLASQGVKLSVNDFVTRAVALACLQHPVMNASWTGDAIQYHGTVNVGTAIALPAERGGGLVVAVTRDVQNKGLRQIAAEVKTIAKKARDKGLTPDEMSDATITISNLGMPQYGITQFGAIVNPPNAAIIAVGAAIKQPVVKTVDGEDTIAIGHLMQVTLSGDHRVIDGASAAEYLATLRTMLEHPATLMV